jgi:hypothetical protein
MIRVFGAVVRQGRMEYKKLRLTAIPKGQSAKLKCLVRRSKVSREGHTTHPKTEKGVTDICGVHWKIDTESGYRVTVS